MSPWIRRRRKNTILRLSMTDIGGRSGGVVTNEPVAVAPIPIKMSVSRRESIISRDILHQRRMEQFKRSGTEASGRRLYSQPCLKIEQKERYT